MTEHHPQPSFVTHRSFKHFCVNSFKDDLSRVPWSVLDVFDDPDDKADAFTLLFVDVLDDHAPSKTTRVKKNPSPWITKRYSKRWIGVIGSTGSFNEIPLPQHGTSTRPSGTVLFGYSGRRRLSFSTICC